MISKRALLQVCGTVNAPNRGERYILNLKQNVPPSRSVKIQRSADGAVSGPDILLTCDKLKDIRSPNFLSANIMQFEWNKYGHTLQGEREIKV